MDNDRQGAPTGWRSRLYGALAVAAILMFLFAVYILSIGFVLAGIILLLVIAVMVAASIARSRYSSKPPTPR